MRLATVVNLINPLHPRGGYGQPHLALLLAGSILHGAAGGPSRAAAATYVPPSGPTYSIVPKGWVLPVGAAALPRTGSAAPWYVHGVVTRDTGIDLSATLNHWGDVYGVSPVGLTAVAATESGIRQYADRYGIWPDVSFGLVQVTVATATGYGVCVDTVSCRTWLDNPYNAIWLEARYLAAAQQQTCLIFPTLYTAYNMGAGYGCNASIYYYPNGQAYSNYQNFLGNWYYVLNTYAGGVPPPPPPPPTPRPTSTPKPVHHAFPLRTWRSVQGNAAPSPWWHHRLSLVAASWLHSTRYGGIRGHEVWHLGSQMMSTPFRYGVAYSWPGRRGHWPVKWDRPFLHRHQEQS